MKNTIECKMDTSNGSYAGKVIKVNLVPYNMSPVICTVTVLQIYDCNGIQFNKGFCHMPYSTA